MTTVVVDTRYLFLALFVLFFLLSWGCPWVPPSWRLLIRTASCLSGRKPLQVHGYLDLWLYCGRLSFGRICYSGKKRGIND